MTLPFGPGTRERVQDGGARAGSRQSRPAVAQNKCSGSEPPAAYFREVPGAAMPRCISASTPAGVTLAMADCSLFFQPLTTSPSPRIMASKPVLATSAGSSFFGRADLGVHHVGALEEFGLGGARHQAGHGDAGVLQLGAQREGEGVEERLGAVVDRLEGAGHEAGDRAGDQDPAAAAGPHVAADLVHQIERAGDVGVDHMPHVVEVLIEERLAEATAGIGEQCLDRPAGNGRIELYRRPRSWRDRPRTASTLTPSRRSSSAARWIAGSSAAISEIEAVHGASPGELVGRCRWRRR